MAKKSEPLVTIPHTNYRHLEWHWLWAERAWQPTMAQWLQKHWYCIGEVEPVSPEEMHRRGWLWLSPALPPPTPQEMGDEKEVIIPDFGMHYETLDGPYPVTLSCKYVVPGKTFSDLINIFKDAESEYQSTDSLSANLFKWKNSRGVNAVLNTILEAIYSKDPLMRMKAES